MAIFKVIDEMNGIPVGYATSDGVEEYLKAREDKEVSALNADPETFSSNCKIYAAKFNTCQNYDDLKYKHYVQGFPPEDCDKMTKEECHELGLEVARTFWKDFPVLVVTHYGQEVEGTGEYHWHNHFIVYNCNVTNGKKINTKGSELWAQKRFIAAQAEAHGLTRKGLILENGRIRESKQEVKYTMDELRLQQRKTAPMSGIEFLTQKAELRFAIISAAAHTDNYEDFCKYLDDKFKIKTKESRGALGFMHPDRRGQARAWIRGKSLGEAYTKEAIINGFKERRNLGNVRDNSEDERAEQYSRFIGKYIGEQRLEYDRQFIDRIYGRNTSTAQDGRRTDTRAITEDELAEKLRRGYRRNAGGAVPGASLGASQGGAEAATADTRAVGGNTQTNNQESQRTNSFGGAKL